jgi:hypothetical protein
MMMQLKSYRTLVASIGVVLLTACGDGIGGPLSSNSGAFSHISSDAKRHDLLYISYYEDQTIGVFDYPSLKAVGTIAGRGDVLGLCTNAAGDVFVGSGGVIYEYKHGGTTPIATLYDGKRYAWACSVDPSTGNLAVVSTASPSGDNGDVAIYARARGTPKKYRSARFLSYFGCGYDPSGNLYVLGFAKNRSFPILFAELPKGGDALKLITLGHTPLGEGDVQWDGAYVAVSSPNEGEIFQFQVKGSRAKEVGVTNIDAKDVEQFSFPGINGHSNEQATQVIGTSYEFGTFMAWNYPAGGTPTISMQSRYGEALSAVLSVAQ